MIIPGVLGFLGFPGVLGQRTTLSPVPNICILEKSSLILYSPNRGIPTIRANETDT